MNAPIFFNVNRRWLFLFLETFKFQIESEGVGGWGSSDWAPVWPDLVKFHHFGKILNDFCKC